MFRVYSVVSAVSLKVHFVIYLCVVINLRCLHHNLNTSVLITFLEQCVPLIIQLWKIGIKIIAEFVHAITRKDTEYGPLFVVKFWDIC